MISDEIGVAKPAAEYFELAFELMSGPPKKVVMIIGDSLTSDMAGGIAYGIDTCWFNPKRYENEDRIHITYEISEHVELLTIVGAHS